MSRLNPKNREEAFTYQFEDDVKVLRACAHNSEDAFNRALTTLETHIKSYRKKPKNKNGRST